MSAENPRLLNFNPVVSQSFTMSLTRDCICPMVLTRGSDQLPVSTKFDMRSDLGVVRNYGRLLLEMVSVVPDGIVCFFVSYSYMDEIVNSWNESGILKVFSDLPNYGLIDDALLEICRHISSGQDDDDSVTVQSQPLPRDVFRIRQIQKARVTSSQTGSTSYGSAFSGDFSGSTG